MAGLDLFSVQEDILDYAKANIHWEVESGAIPEYATLKMVDGKLEPYVVLRFSEIMPTSGGGTWGGATDYEFYSYVDALCVGATDREARELSSVVNRLMLGKVFPNASELRKSYGGGTFGVPDASRIPVAYISIASFAFNTNLSDVGSATLPA